VERVARPPKQPTASEGDCKVYPQVYARENFDGTDEHGTSQTEKVQHFRILPALMKHVHTKFCRLAQAGKHIEHARRKQAESPQPYLRLNLSFLAIEKA
jgi:hypothetical protein